MTPNQPQVITSQDSPPTYLLQINKAIESCMEAILRASPSTSNKPKNPTILSAQHKSEITIPTPSTTPELEDDSWSNSSDETITPGSVVSPSTSTSTSTSHSKEEDPNLSTGLSLSLNLEKLDLASDSNPISQLSTHNRDQNQNPIQPITNGTKHTTLTKNCHHEDRKIVLRRIEESTIMRQRREKKRRKSRS